MWLITASLAHILCAVGYAYLRSGPLVLARLLWIMPIIFAGSICFAITYRLGPKFFSIWFVTAGIGALVGFAASRALKGRISPLEILGVCLIVTGAGLLMRGR